MAKATTKPETIYIEADTDIAAVIESLKATQAAKVSFVVPKRGEILRSIVNLKLLLAISLEMKKDIALITSDKIIVGLAGQLQIPVSPNLKTAPKVPKDPRPSQPAPKAQTPIIIEAPFTPRSIVRRRREKIMAKPAKKQRTPGAWRRPLAWSASGLLGLGLIAVGIWLLLGSIASPSATVTIQTSRTPLPVSLTVSLSAAYDQVATEPLQLPLHLQTSNQPVSQTIEATGRENLGEFAQGEITVQNCDRENRFITITQNTVFTLSDSQLRYRSLSDRVSLRPAAVINGRCRLQSGTYFTVPVQAVERGTAYNTDPGGYEIRGLAGYNYIADGDSMTGGSDHLATVISEDDIEAARTRLADSAQTSQIQASLREMVEAEGMVALPGIFETEAGQVEVDVEVGQEVDQGQVSQMFSYRLGAVKLSDLQTLIGAQLRAQAGDKQIINDGLATASYELVSAEPVDGVYDLKIRVKDAQASLVLDSNEIFESIKGRPADEVGAELRQLSGVTTVDIDLKPFWRSTIPDLRSQVDIIINDGHDG